MCAAIAGVSGKPKWVMTSSLPIRLCTKFLLSVSKLIAPYTPFLSEFLYQNLTNGEAEESIHMEAYPRLSEEQREAVNLTLEHKMELTQTIVFLARSLRNDVQIKVRQPPVSYTHL